MYLVAKELVAIAKCLLADYSLIQGKTVQTAKKRINDLLSHYTQGIFSDDSWRQIKKIWDAMTDAGIDWTLLKSEYKHNDKGIPNSKTWQFEIKFIDNNGREKKMIGYIIAAGSGSISDPLEKYDVTAYVS